MIEKLNLLLYSLLAYSSTHNLLIDQHGGLDLAIHTPHTPSFYYKQQKILVKASNCLVLAVFEAFNC